MQANTPPHGEKTLPLSSILQLNLPQARKKSPISLISFRRDLSKVLAVTFQYLNYFQYSFLYSLCIHFYRAACNADAV